MAAYRVTAIDELPKPKASEGELLAAGVACDAERLDGVYFEAAGNFDANGLYRRDGADADGTPVFKKGSKWLVRAPKKADPDSRCWYCVQADEPAEVAEVAALTPIHERGDKPHKLRDGVPPAQLVRRAPLVQLQADGDGVPLRQRLRLRLLPGVLGRLRREAERPTTRRWRKHDAEVAATTKSAEERTWEQLRHNAEAIALYTSADDGEMPPAAWAPAPLGALPAPTMRALCGEDRRVLKQEEGCVEAFRTALTLGLPASALAAEGADGDGEKRRWRRRRGGRDQGEGLLRNDAGVARREGRRQGRRGGGGPRGRRRWRSRTPTATRSSSSAAPTGSSTTTSTAR